MTAAAPMTVLYDGGCRFCTRSAHSLRRWIGRDRVALTDFQPSGVLDAYPGISRDAAMKRIHVVMPDGRIFAGAEAFARMLATLRWVGWAAWVYYVPGLRQLANVMYDLIAKYRYRLFGRTEECDGGTCHLHGTG
jgi:predicted DCC family thiol-disulfide oxidoreductase YuxK